MTEWKKYKLGDIGQIRMCKRILKEETNPIVGIPFYKISTFGQMADVYISPDTYLRYKKLYAFPKKGEVLISAAGTIGRTVIYNGEDAYFQDSNIVWIENDETKVLNEYLYYCYQNIQWKISNGSTILRLYNDDIRNTQISVPDLPTQKRIASVLSNIDRKIALNRAMNEELEQTARDLYNYWFLQFDFPDANGNPYRSSGGKMVYNDILKREIPQGWEVGKVGDVAVITNGATPSTREEENYGGDIVWITPDDLSKQKRKFTYFSSRCITEQGYKSCSTHLMPAGTILLSSRAPIGLLSIAMVDLCTNQGFKSLVPIDMRYTKYLYYSVQTHMEQIKKLGTGSTFSEISKKDLEPFPILMASDSLIEVFNQKVGKIFDEQFVLVKEIDHLTSLRDELLPLLMNGQVTITE
ncbi:MAG: restriction endonuclease subunit S [Paludibacteraceae bacterium]|nr:restriction endonuclease subunit S [Paludibacteraceae bacterium]